MPSTDPIDIKFLINSDEVKKMANDVVSSVHGVTRDAQGQTGQFTAQFDAMFQKIGKDLQGAFSTDKLDALSNQLAGVNGAGQRFATTLSFIKENIGDLKLNPDDARETVQTIDALTSAISNAGAGLDDLSVQMGEKLGVASMSISQLNAKLKELKESEDLVGMSLKNAHDPGLLNNNKKMLDEILASEKAITDELAKRANPKSGTPETDVNRKMADGMKAQRSQAIELQRTMNGLFGVMTSSMLLTQMLSGENKRYTETFAKLMTVYAIVRGAVEAYKNVQQVSNVIGELSNKIFKTHAVVAAADATATGAQAVATEGATVATKGLNAALAANPIGLIITAVVAVTTAIITYIKSVKSADEKQKEFNETLLKSRQLLAEVFDLMNTGRKEAVENAKADISLAQARGASETEILALKKKQLDAERELLNAKIGENLGDVQNLEVNRQRLSQLLQAQQSLESREDLSSKEEKRLDALKSQVSIVRDQVKVGEELTKGIRDNNNALTENASQSANAAKEDAKRAAAASKANNELARRNAVTNAEAAAAAQTQGTAEWLKAELAAIDVREKADIASARAAGETIVKIQQDADNARRAAEQRFNQQQLSDRISNINVQLSAVQKGSLEEMQLRIDAQTIQRDIELNQIGISAAKRKEIEARTEAEIAEIRKKYNADVNAADLRSRESNINAALSVVERGGKDELNLRLQLLELRSLSEAQQAQNTITNEEELQAKITEIYAKKLAERGKLQQEFFDKSVNDQLSAIDKSFDQQKSAIQNQSNNSPIGNRVARDNQELLAIQIEINREQAKHTALQKAFNDATEKGVGSLSKLSKASKESEENIARFQDRLEKIKRQKLLDQFAEIANSLNSIGDSLGTLGNSISEFNEGLGDTINTIGQLANAAGDVMAGLASGNPLGVAAGVVKGVSAIVNIFAAARESERKANAEMKKYQDNLIKGAIAYNQLLRDRERTQKDITTETVAELEARKRMLATQQSQAQQDYDKLLAQIQSSGKQIVGEHKEKYGGFLGVGKKTRVVQDLANVTGFDFDTLEKLFTEGKLDDATAAWFQELKKVRDEMNNITDATADAEEQLRKVLTGTTADSIADSIIRGFSDGKTAVEDFADSFEELMKQAILSSIQVNTLKKPLESFYEQFANMAESGGKLDMNEVNALQAQYNAIIQNASNQFDQLKEVTGMSFGLSSQPGLSGAISRTITEDTANELSGLMRGEYDYVKRQFGALTDSLSVQRKIEANTANMVVTMNGSLEELKKITVNTRDTNQSVRDLGL